MKTSIRVGGPNTGGREHFEAVVNLSIEAEKLGLDRAWSAEAWGMDAISPLAYIAAKTERLELGTGIAQVCARTPASTAMAALSMDTVTNGRFLLGLGNSGPQVVEGLHGQPFDRPLTRMRETIDIVRLACRGEKLAYDGWATQLPRPGGKGKALRLALPAVDVPIHLATLSPNALELTGELADGWLGTSFTPDAAEAHLGHLRRGAEKAGRSLEDISLCVNATVAISDNPEPLIQMQKPAIAFQLSAMGSPTMNFYNDAYARSGFEQACTEVRDIWLSGDRAGAVAAVPDEMVWQTSLIGDEARVRERIRAYRDVGINELMLHPMGKGADAQLETLGRAVELVHQECGAS